MPRKAKDLTESVEKAKKVVKDTKPNTSKTKKASVKTTKSVTSKVASTKATKQQKSTTTKKANKPKQTTTSKKASTKKTTTSKKTTRTKKPEVLEYYDLPYRYNQTIVKILAQTPSTLFVYWDISDADRKKYIDRFGENFFNDTYPVLIVHNKTMNYSFEIEINDFANSWYFNVNDAKCDYDIELGRRAKRIQNMISLPNNYQYITSSNNIEAPNDHILFEKFQKLLFFRNVKTNDVFKKDVSTFEFMRYIGKSQNIYNIYKKMYKEDVNDIYNPSSDFRITN